MPVSVDSKGTSRNVILRQQCGRVLVAIKSGGHFSDPDYLTCLRLEPEDARQLATGLLKWANSIQMEDAPKKTYDVFRRLAQASKELSLVTYEELGDSAGLPPMGLSRQLRFIELMCRRQGLPWLPAIAVSKTTKLPGKGFLPTEWSNWSLENPDFKSWWRAMVLQVYATNWTKAVPMRRPDSEDRSQMSQMSRPAWLSQKEFDDWRQPHREG